jgi:ParB family chromosome partitioning protein
LNPFEEADGFVQLKERFSHTHQSLSEKLGRSRSAVTEAMSIAKIPSPVRELCHSHGVLSRSALLQVARAGTRERMEATVLRIAAGGAPREELVKERQEAEGKPKPGRPKHFKFRWQPEEKSFAVQINFKKKRVSKSEVLTAVRSLLEQLEAAED